MTSAEQALPLSDVDLVYGMPIGYEPVPALPSERVSSDPVVSMEAVLTRALQRPPCLISFSGGRDSSAMLALAVRVARREGLALPIPATLVIQDSAEAAEDDWQRIMIDHLGLQDWVRISISDELDIVGPVATAALARHGLLWPFNTHFHAPIMERATGGSLVTGFGGDEVALSSETARAEQVLARRRRPHPIDAAVVGLAISPRPVRSWVLRRRAVSSTLKPMVWLTDEGRRSVSRAIGVADAAIPLGWSRVLRHAIWRSRYFRTCEHSFAVLAAARNVEVHHPFADRAVLQALAARGGFGGIGSRTDLVRALFGDALPPAVVKRPTKATFDDAMWTSAARQFAQDWSGGGLPSRFVEGDRLRKHWLEPRPHALSSPLLQAAWLHDYNLNMTR